MRPRPGFDQIAQGMGGLMSVTGLPGQGPVRAGIPVADLTTGLYTAIGILIALVEREKTGKGRWIHCSLLEAMISMMDFQAARWTVEGEVAQQAGNDHPTTVPTGLFHTSDGTINVAAGGQTMWDRLQAVLGFPDDPELATEAQRTRQRAKVNALLQKYLLDDTAEEWVRRLNEAGVPCGPVYTMDQVFADPQVQHLGMTLQVNSEHVGKLALIRPAMQIAGAAPRTRRDAGARRAHGGGTGRIRLRRRPTGGSARCRRHLTRRARSPRSGSTSAARSPTSSSITTRPGSGRRSRC